MNITDIIRKKKCGYKLNELEINYVINAYTSDLIKDYQMSALLMAICLKGMDEEETFYLTKAMLNSGEQLDLSFIHGTKVDKHSTGGVGDKTTLIVLPIVAACGVKAPKMSGRGLGFTGGTIDKLESIPGLKTALSKEEFIQTTLNVGMCVTSQTGNLVPADKKIYALRDVTETVDSIPLIASSIMSKKLASGADKIILDVKVGNGALLKTYEESKKLAELMVEIGHKFHRQTIAILSNMNEPLGYAIGNAVEIREVIDTLLGRGEKRLVEISLTLAANMISLAKDISYTDAFNEAKSVLDSGHAYQKFLEFIEAQKGNLSLMEDAKYTQEIKAETTGYIQNINALYLANIALKLGAGRMVKEDIIDHQVGIILKKKQGDYVHSGDVIALIKRNKDIEISNVLEAFTIFLEEPSLEPIVYEIIS